VRRPLLAATFAVAVAVAACHGASDVDPGAGDSADAGPSIDLNQTARADGGHGPKPNGDGTAPSPGAGTDGTATGPIRFATNVVSFTPGTCAGFGQSAMPGVVLGPPKGAGDRQGSLDVVSLGGGGEIVLSFDPAVIVDGPGTDFIVFENAFFSGGDPANPYVELGEVSVSEDGTTWSTFPCTSTSLPYVLCAGWHPVYASGPDFDPATAGGDPFDLSTIGVARARFVRVRDKTAERCTSQGPNTNGFDLDAMAALHSEEP
jgi:hypothetical protein